MRASRLLATLLLLQTRGRMTAQELADELEVSVRTVYRDVEALSSSGVPVYADRGSTGGYQLLEGYRTKLTGLTADEAGALFLGLGPGLAAELGVGAALAAAQLKLLAALPPELRDKAGQVRQRFHLDAPGWFRDAEAPPWLDLIADAVWAQQPAQITYTRWDDSTVHRRIEPLGLVLKGSAWYVVARGRQNINAYRVARIQTASTVDDEFERPDDFDLQRFWTDWSQRLERTLYRGEATVRLSPRAVGLWPLNGAVAERALRETGGEPDERGWITVVVPIESVEHGLVDLLRFGPDLEVLEPPELRRRMRDAAERMLGLYT